MVPLDTVHLKVWEADKATGVNVGTECDQLERVPCGLHVEAITTTRVSNSLSKMSNRLHPPGEVAHQLLVCFGNVKSALECLSMCMARWIYKSFTTFPALHTALAQCGCYLPMLHCI